jgi:hypothetical protein
MDRTGNWPPAVRRAGWPPGGVHVAFKRLGSVVKKGIATPIDLCHAERRAS